MIPSHSMAIRLHPPGGVESLVHEELPTPVPGPGEVLVRVHAAAITRGELDWPLGDLPRTPSFELSGTVAALGPGTSGPDLGQPVFAMTAFDEDGVAREYVTVAAERLAAKPASLRHVEAAAMPLPGLSAMQGLFGHGRLEEGQRVLVHGGGGGVGAYAVQLAHLHGAHVIATATGERIARARELGADEVVDHVAGDFTALDPVDLVFDTAGGDRLARSVEVLEEGGRLVSVAEHPPAEAASDRGIEASFFVVEHDRAQLAELAGLAEEHRLSALVDSTYPLAEAAPAFRRSLDRDVQGKVVLAITPDG